MMQDLAGQREGSLSTVEPEKVLNLVSTDDSMVLANILWNSLLFASPL